LKSLASLTVAGPPFLNAMGEAKHNDADALFFEAENHNQSPALPYGADGAVENQGWPVSGLSPGAVAGLLVTGNLGHFLGFCL
jgi:hypothetical protein